MKETRKSPRKTQPQEAEEVQVLPPPKSQRRSLEAELENCQSKSKRLSNESASFSSGKQKKKHTPLPFFQDPPTTASRDAKRASKKASASKEASVSEPPELEPEVKGSKETPKVDPLLAAFEAVQSPYRRAAKRTITTSTSSEVKTSEDSSSSSRPSRSRARTSRLGIDDVTLEDVVSPRKSLVTSELEAKFTPARASKASEQEAKTGKSSKALDLNSEVKTTPLRASEAPEPMSESTPSRPSRHKTTTARFGIDDVNLGKVFSPSGKASAAQGPPQLPATPTGQKEENKDKKKPVVIR